jgi:alkylation response protein AidB-like acyl-CoA dehydrogenase
MSEGLSAKTLDYKERAREVAEKYVRPAAAELDRTGEYGWDILEALKKYELTGIWIPRSTAARTAASSTSASSSRSSRAPAAASAWPSP